MAPSSLLLPMAPLPSPPPAPLSIGGSSHQAAGRRCLPRLVPSRAGPAFLSRRPPPCTPVLPPPVMAVAAATPWILPVSCSSSLRAAISAAPLFFQRAATLGTLVTIEMSCKKLWSALS
ncbi:hypothetical protein U9M48_027147 [Paspalum notatum var. saurae]|uniref:Uncharacterized protein n=1 Tax=Paspalum notatum var. saurae TaxID=547442 RepID=A0AAQ3TWR0_PASNO